MQERTAITQNNADIASTHNVSVSNEPANTEPSWEMFEKVKELGVGSFGVVY
jgi:hypothetical protein